MFGSCVGRVLASRPCFVRQVGPAWLSLALYGCSGRPIPSLGRGSTGPRRGKGRRKKMRKIQVLGVALLALFAFGALTAVSASATNTYLLAEWLLNGVAIGLPANEINLVEIDGELLLEDTKAVLGSPAEVKCMGSLDGWVGLNSLGFTSEVLNTVGGGEAISTT